MTALLARTDSAGYYEFAAVPPGLWQVSIPRDGLDLTWAVPRTAPRLSVAKREKVAIHLLKIVVTFDQEFANRVQ